MEEAAKAFGMTLKDFKFRLTKWGHRLPLLLSTLDKIKADRITRPQAAETLGVTGRQINYLMGTWNVERPVKTYVIDKQRAQLKWEIRKKFAIDFIGGSINLDAASDAAGVSTRQMRRWVSELLEKHFQMPFKDLNELSLHRRSRLAHEIERVEGLEAARQQVIDAIATGQKTLNDEAINRAASNRRRKPHV